MNTYFDHNATTAVDSRVVDAMLPYFQRQYGNPSSLHHDGRMARTAIDTARQQVAALVNARPEQVVFVGSGTEANNLALKGALAACPKGRVGMSAIEHPSVLEQMPCLQAQGWTADRLSVNKEGELCLGALTSWLKHADCRLLSVMAANNETGVVQDIQAIAAFMHEHDGLFHSDATQAAGKIALDFAESRVDLMTLSAHKLYGPKGVGALVVADGIELSPLLHGGGHELGRRSGTENVPAIVGFGVAAELAKQQLSVNALHVENLRNRLEKRLSGLAGFTVFSKKAKRLPNTSCFSLPALHGEAVVMQLDKQGFSVSSGSACEYGTDEPSHVLTAMSVEDNTALGAIRVSMGKDNTQQEVDALIKEVTALSVLAQCSTAAW